MKIFEPEIEPLNKSRSKANQINKIEF